MVDCFVVLNGRGGRLHQFAVMPRVGEKVYLFEGLDAEGAPYEVVDVVHYPLDSASSEHAQLRLEKVRDDG